MSATECASFARARSSCGPPGSHCQCNEYGDACVFRVGNVNCCFSGRATVTSVTSRGDGPGIGGAYRRRRKGNGDTLRPTREEGKGV